MNTPVVNSVNVTINGKSLTVPKALSVVQALWLGGYPRIESLGCLEGVCGSCRVLVRRAGSAVVSTELACQLLVEEGLDVSFLPYTDTQPRTYQLGCPISLSSVLETFTQTFPEAAKCRHCGGCDNSCPKGITVESAITLATAGDYQTAGEMFLECVLCELCETACPEFITPAQIGTFSRKVTTLLSRRPSNLIHRIEALAHQQFKVDIDR